jgi:hypothetical protein
MAGARKLVVEVVAAKGLMPKDGQGSTNAYCVVGCTSFLFIEFLGSRSSGLRGMQFYCRKYSRLWRFLVGLTYPQWRRLTKWSSETRTRSDVKLQSD